MPTGRKVGEREGQGQASQTPTATLDDLSKEAQLKKLVDPKTGGLSGEKAKKVTDALAGKGAADQALRGQGGRTLGGKPGADLGKDIAAGSTVSRDAGKPQVSKQEQQSETKAPEKEKPFLQKVGDAISKGYADVTKAVGDLTGKDKFQRQEENTRRNPPRAIGVRGMPNPETDTGAGPGQPKALQALPKQKSPGEIEAEKKRQVTLPGEGQRQLSPENLPEVTGKDIVKKRTEGLTQPAEGEGRPGAQPKQPWQGKGPQPGDPIDPAITGGSKPSKPSGPGPGPAPAQ